MSKLMFGKIVVSVLVVFFVMVSLASPVVAQAYTITITDTTAGSYDTVNMSVSEKTVTFDVPFTVVIGEMLNIKGTANAGSTVDVWVDGTLYAKLNDIVIGDGTFSKEVPTTEVGMTRPGLVRLRAWIDCDKNPGDDPPTSSADGDTEILLTFPGITVNLSTSIVQSGGTFVVNGTVKSYYDYDYLDIITISPKGGSGTGLYGKSYPEVPGITTETIPVENDSFSKTINVSEHADAGRYVIWVSVPGGDGNYNWYDVNNASELIKHIIDDYHGGDASKLRSRPQYQILAILVDATISRAGSDDLAWADYLKVEAIEIFDTGTPENPYPSIMGTHWGTIKPAHDVNVRKMFTYSCVGTGGHSERVAFYNSTTGIKIANGTWKGYAVGDYHYIEFDKEFVLHEGITYNYTIKTGSYPQIIHEHIFNTTSDGEISCTEFIDANGKRYNNWIPAIRLE
ncbi:MAG: hypothetical protein KAT65_13760 [Methanophagales archaeon]|nr:hypothetical protein [Methanophagales archaeon]